MLLFAYTLSLSYTTYQNHVVKHTPFLPKWLVIDNNNHFIFCFLISKYMSNVDSWCKACGEVDLPSELQDLEDAIHHHQGIYEHITLAYSEVRLCFT